MLGGLNWIFGGMPKNSGKMKDALNHVLDAVSREFLVLVPYLDVKTTSHLLQRLLSKGLELGQIKLRIVISPDPLPYVTRQADLDALQRLLDTNNPWVSVEARVAHPLHAKVYLADSSLALVTSANLTGGGLVTNAEAGFLVSDETVLQAIRSDFESYWASADALTPESLNLARNTMRERSFLKTLLIEGQSFNLFSNNIPDKPPRKSSETKSASTLRQVEPKLITELRKTGVLWGILRWIRDNHPSDSTLRTWLSDFLPVQLRNQVDSVIGAMVQYGVIEPVGTDVANAVSVTNRGQHFLDFLTV